MAKINEIILKHGKLSELAAYVGLSPNTCKMYLRGWYDADITAKADEVRRIAVEDFGGIELR